MNLALATDNNFVQHCAVTIVSILKNNPNDINIYILTEGLTNSNEDLIKKVVTENGGKIFIVLINSESLKDCPMPKLDYLSHISLATYYRLLISKLLPTNIDKVIYLDCDIVVRKSLVELWNYSISEYAIGAVYQVVNTNVSAAKRLGYPAYYGYFNAGVLLINLNYWRENCIPEKLFEYINCKRNVIIFHDQDALNGLLYDKCFRLPCKWNMLTIFFMKITMLTNDIDNGKIVNDYLDYKNQMPIEANDPVIIHYVSKPKPWDIGCTHPYKKEYFKYLQHTPWHSYNIPNVFIKLLNEPETIFNIIKSIIIKILRGNPYIKIKN